MQKQLKQRYLHLNGPYPFDFEDQRKKVLEKIMSLIVVNDRNKWLGTGFNPLGLIEWYKQVYGLTSHQLENIVSLFIEIGFCEENLSTEVRVLIFKFINKLRQYQIKITSNLIISNKAFLKKLLMFSKQMSGLRTSLKNADDGIQQMAKVVLDFSEFGEDIIRQALQCAIKEGDIRYLVLFIGSLKDDTKAAQDVLNELLCDNSMWERDASWFYLLSQIFKKFPCLDYSEYYHTIFQQIIRAFTTITESQNEQIIRKITGQEGFLGTRSILKSISMIQVYLILPQKYPQHILIKTSIQRIFNLISTSLDHTNPPDCLNQHLIYLKTFIKYFLMRHRKEQGRFEEVNEDSVVDYHKDPIVQPRLDQSAYVFFDSLWTTIIRKLLFFEDGEECKNAKILTDLAMYKPQMYIEPIFEQIYVILNREDIHLVSLGGLKMTVLFLQEYMIRQNRDFIEIYIDTTVSLLALLDKLQISQNLDVLELVMRSFMFFYKSDLNDKKRVEDMVEDILNFILQNLDTMSIALEGSDGENAQIYMDLSNIYMPFFISLSDDQKSTFQDKFLYRMVNKVPDHFQAYELIVSCLCYTNKQYSSKLLKKVVFKKLLTTQITQVQKTTYFFSKPKHSFSITNQNQLKWYNNLAQDLLEYHPDLTVQFWQQIQEIMILFISEWDSQIYLEMGLDLIFNSVLSLCRPHISPSQFIKQSNGSYEKLSLKWNPITKKAYELLDKIFNKYFDGVIIYMKERFSETVKNSSKDVEVLNDFQNYDERKKGTDTIRIRKRNLKLVNCLLFPDLGKTEDLIEKKIIYRLLSLQYTILSALMLRVPFFSEFQCQEDFFNQSKYKNLRKSSCNYLEWVLQLLCHYNMLPQENVIKLFNYFWRESHDEVFFTSIINSTVQKLAPYFYTQSYRKKQLLKCPYLIINEAYLIHMSRLELLLEINPTAYRNNKNYLETGIVMSLNPNYEAALHSYLPTSVDVHQYHRELASICRHHLDCTHSQSFLSKYLIERNPTVKERYLNALKNIFMSIKKSQNLYNLQCCMRDQFVRNTVIDLVELFQIFTKKNDKNLVIQVVSAVLIFNFDNSLLKESAFIQLNSKFRSRIELGVDNFEVSSVNATLDLVTILSDVEKINDQAVLNQNQVLSLKMTRSCSHEHHYNDIYSLSSLEKFQKKLLAKIMSRRKSAKKDTGIYILMLMLYSNQMPLEHPIFKEIIPLFFQLCQIESLEIYEICKAGIFHIINRFNYHLRKSRTVPNTPIKRELSEFLKMRCIGGENVNYELLKVQKKDMYFYPEQELVEYTYDQLASNPKSKTYQNQKVLLNQLNSDQSILGIFKIFAKDSEFKAATNNDMLTQQSMRTFSNSGNKLMHYIWDHNPNKTVFFLGIIDNYSNYPINFFSRFVRKLIRIGDSKVISTIENVAKTLQNGEKEEAKLSVYISTELMLLRPLKNQKFINFIGEVSNEIFDQFLICIYNVFSSNFALAEKIYRQIRVIFRQLKGSSRLRHWQILNAYMMAQGRFARNIANEGIEHMLKGIEEGTNEIVQAVVSMIAECYIIAFNLKILPEWVSEPSYTLIKKKQIFKLNAFVGYDEQPLLKKLLKNLLQKSNQQKNLQSINLKIYSQIVKKILASLYVYRFNDFFFEFLKQFIYFVIERPAQDDESDELVISQLKDSEYPENVFQQLVERLLKIDGLTLYAIKKKIRLIEGIAISHAFIINKVEIPPLLEEGPRNITVDFIIAYANISKVMTPSELNCEVERILKKQIKSKSDNYKLLAYLICAGVCEYPWKEDVLRDLAKMKKDKIVKECISEWWKGKNIQSNQEKQLSILVKNFENPYSYFA